ncbi:OmpH family outer membrane protein [Lignipirellula cremea]|uniref:Outer membrane protein (OmpH-like) n=1 Tax=Lignipirellula cremea TaxID=2528010 RepID=A0A518DNH6_9BACT|nr:OmpH family outer membrane protein [Lignipirellula cremea]QDU93386.1 Outer membrane protein (OmpH-like) [Lignipirellula cremea]
MKASIVAAMAACMVCGGLLVSTVSAQSQSPVVVLDVSKVFKEHIRFKQDLQLMTKDAEAFQAYIQQQEIRVKALLEEQQGSRPGDPVYNRTDEEMTRIRSEVQVQSQLKKKELMMREAKVYFQYYNELQAEVGKFCDAQKISLVIRWNSEPIDQDDRVSVQQGVNNSIVYQRNLDITPLMIEKVNMGVPQPGPDNRNAAIPARPSR